MHGILPIFLLLMLLSLSTGNQSLYEDDPNRLVREILSRFEKISEATFNFAEKLKLIKDTTAAFLKLAIPLGALLEAGFNIIHKPLSKEYIALQELRQEMGYKFHRLEARLNYSFDNAALTSQTWEFSDKVTQKLNILMKKFVTFSNPKVIKTNESIVNLVTECNDQGTMIKTAEYIRVRLTVGCHLYDGHVQVKLLKFLKNVRSRFNVKPWSSENEITRNIENVIYSLEPKEALTVLKDLERKVEKISFVRKPFTAIFEMIKHLHTGSSYCFTDTVFRASFYNRNVVSNLQEVVQLELGRLMVAASLCGYFQIKSISDFNDYLVQIDTDIKQTASFIADYIPRKLNVSTLHIEPAVVENAIEFYGSQGSHKSTTPIPHVLFSDLSKVISESLKNIGLKSTKKQVLIFPNSIDDPTYSSISICPDHWCSSITRQRGVDVLIVRCPEESIFSARDLELALEKRQPNISAVLQKSHNLPLPEIMKSLAGENITLTTGFSKSAAIVRNSVNFLASCSFPTAVLPHRQQPTFSRSGVANMTFQYVKLDPWENNECVHVFMIL